MIPKCIIAITKLSIIAILRQWSRNNSKIFMLLFSITDSFVDFCEGIWDKFLLFFQRRELQCQL